MTDAAPKREGTAAASPACPHVSIIVVSYNTREMTLDCLRSIRRETRTPHEIIVIDNASQDGSAAAIAREFPDIPLVAETVNHGFGRANNLAAERARAPLILLLNPDTLVLDHAIDRLAAFAARAPEAGIWGGRTVFGDRRLNPGSCWRAMSLWSLFCQAAGLSALFRGSGVFNPEAYGGWSRDDEREVDIVAGCFFLIRRELWQALGGFDARYVMYGEEADLCLRAKARGARPAITPDAEIVHYAGASQTVQSDRFVRLFRGKVTLIRRHFTGWRRPFGVFLFRGWPLTRYLAYRALALLGRPGAGEQARTWGEILRRRDEWLPGYPDRGTPS